MKPRVMFLSPVADFRGGAEFSLFDMLENPAIEPLLCTPGEGALTEEARRLGVPCATYRQGLLERVHRPAQGHSMAASVFDVVRAAREVRAVATAHKVEIIHSNGLKAHAVALALRGLFGARTIIHVHDIAYSPLERAIWRSLPLGCDRLILVSRLCWPGRSLPRGAEIVPNGLDMSRYTPRSGAPQSPWRIGFIGRIHPFKGLHVLCDWLEAAAAAGHRFRFVIRGEAQAPERAYWEGIKQRLASSSFAGAVAIEGWVAQDKAYDDLDLVVVPSLNPEPFGRVTIEAMAWGIPVLASPSGHTANLIADRKTGFLVQTPADFVRALDELGANPSLYGALARAARAFVAAELSQGRFLQHVNEIYQSILEQGARREAVRGRLSEVKLHAR